VKGDQKIMFKEVQIIYDYGNHKGKEMNQEMSDTVTFKNIKPEDAKKIISVIDQENVPVEDVINFFRLISNKGKVVKAMAEFETREQKVEKYISAHPGISYREAVLKSGVTEREDFLAPDEAVRIAGLLDGGISSVDLTKNLSVFSEATRKKLNEAYRILTDAKRELELIAEKPLEK
jgi:hypothetical protein